LGDALRQTKLFDPQERDFDPIITFGTLLDGLQNFLFDLDQLDVVFVGRYEMRKGMFADRGVLLGPNQSFERALGLLHRTIGEALEENSWFDNPPARVDPDQQVLLVTGEGL